MIRAKGIRSFLCLFAYLSMLGGTLYWGHLKSDGRLLSSDVDQDLPHSPIRTPASRMSKRRTIIPLW